MTHKNASMSDQSGALINARNDELATLVEIVTTFIRLKMYFLCVGKRKQAAIERPKIDG